MKQVLKSPNTSAMGNDLINIFHCLMRNRTITTLYHTQILKIVLHRTVFWNDMKFLKIEDCVQCHTCCTYQRPGVTFCSCGSIQQGITAAGQGGDRATNQQSIHHVRPWTSQFSIEEYSKGRRCGNSAESQKLKRLPEFRKETELRN